MSTTPRTDAAAVEAITGLGYCVGVNFARELEQENAWLREILSTPGMLRHHTMKQFPDYEWVASEHYGNIRAMAEETDGLRAENAAQKRWMESAAENLPLLQAENARQAEALQEIIRRSQMLIHQNTGRWDMRLEHDARAHGVTTGNIRIAEAALTPNATGKHT